VDNPILERGVGYGMRFFLVSGMNAAKNRNAFNVIYPAFKGDRNLAVYTRPREIIVLGKGLGGPVPGVTVLYGFEVNGRQAEGNASSLNAFPEAVLRYNNHYQARDSALR